MILIAVITLKPIIIQSILIRFYFFLFLVGGTFTILTYLGYINKNEILNSNTVGFLLAPFIIYLFIRSKSIISKIIFYLFGCILLNYSDATTTFIAFTTMPLFMFVALIVKKMRLLYTVVITLGLVITVWIAFADIEYLTGILATRNILWEKYISFALNSNQSFLTGTGLWVDELISNRLDAHNTFIGLLYFNGIIALLLYLSFIIFSIRKNCNKFTVSDGILFLVIVFQFAESNIHIFSFIAPAFLFTINILINKECEDLDRDTLKLFPTKRQKDNFINTVLTK
jgi:hypothetical protein